MKHDKNISKPTEIMSNRTETMPNKTEIMPNKTEVMYTGESEISTKHVTVGTVLKDQYRIDGVITENTGEATIFLCSKDSKEFVAKVYHKENKPKPEVIDKLKSISSPYVVPILDDGNIYDRYFQILPYYHNRDLEQRAPLSADFISEIVVPNVIEGLKAIHSKGIVHCDIKPNNIFLSDDQKHVIIGDFGISSVLKDVSVGITAGPKLTITFSPPEAMQGIISKERDYYSLGVTLLYLVTGKDPYKGMTNEQIIMLVTSYKLDIPKAVDSRIAMLIRGLTVKDREDRWGYKEVKRWLNGESPEIKVLIPKVEEDKIPPYAFEGQRLDTLNALAFALAEHWSEGIKHLYRGFLSTYLKPFRQDLASKIMDIEEEERDKDLGLFKAIYLLSPDAPLCWKGEMFMDLSKFGEAINNQLPEINNNYFEMLKSGALTHFIKTKGYEKELIDRIIDLQNLALKEKKKAYYKLKFLLNQDYEFKFQGKTFTNVDDLAVYLKEHKQQVEELSRKLLNDVYFFVWLEHLGYGDHIKEWRKTVMAWEGR